MGIFAKWVFRVVCVINVSDVMAGKVGMFSAEIVDLAGAIHRLCRQSSCCVGYDARKPVQQYSRTLENVEKGVIGRLVALVFEKLD